ncbi:MAG TPA: hypothetical protein VFH88_02860, partial [Candidatus Krumholzibacteria bacterium]|nr:hypothetical protein [Candidatus Krumholzibacteria bacterium]
GGCEIHPDVVVDITSTYDTKLESVRAHATQVGGGPGQLATRLNDGTLFGAIEGRALVAGRRVGVRYGEAFQLLAPVRLTGFDAIAPEREP